MARLFLSMIFMLACLTVISQQLIPFKINGRFSSDTLSGKIYLYYSVNGSLIRDSSQIKNGTFSFAGEVVHPVSGRLICGKRSKEIFVEPVSMQILVKDAQLKNVEITGSVTGNEFNEIDRLLARINKRWQTVIDTLSAVNKRSNVAFQELKGWVLTPYFEELQDVYLEFFAKYPQSYVTAYFLSINIIELNQGSLPTDLLKAYYDGFSATIRESWYGRKIMEELAKRKIAVPGTEAIDFTKTDLKGKSLPLSSFRGKYVLLDFWGSWCVPCRKGNPHLKELYQRYKSRGFDIIGIAADNTTPDAWKKAIETDDLPWHHILLDDLDKKYNITSYPTKILIDKNGIIIGRYDSEEKDLDEQLSKIFNSTGGKL